VTFRAQLQENISANGGDYCGDLTKEVTHLIAHTPEGKKYQYATQWEVKIVSLKWLKESLDRRMILDEALYHPTIPKDKQGAGAWNRQARAQVQLVKRTHGGEPASDMPRKLRRTASAKFGSQSENLWGEIVKPQYEEATAENNQLGPSRSKLPRKPTVLEPESFATDTTGMEDERGRDPRRATTSARQGPPTQGIFSGCTFALHGFTLKQVRCLSWQ
jgi:DNA replication regulator DPB11